MAWLAAAFSLGIAAKTWYGGSDPFGSLFFLGLGGGATYLALALPRRVTSAWRACRELASAIGTIHMVVLPSLAIAWLLAVVAGDWDAYLTARTQSLIAAAAATALPWALYHALSDERVRSWFAIADCQQGSRLSS